MMLLVTSALCAPSGSGALSYQLAFGFSALLSMVVLIVAVWKVRS